MSRKPLSFNYIILMVFLQVLVGIWGGTGVKAAEVTLSEAKKTAIVRQCDAIREELVNLQHADSRARVYLGRYYETLLSDYITPLNVRLVENNLANSGLIDNQENFARQRTTFVDDFITYQRELEGLVAMDCKAEPGQFYAKLTEVRAGRKKVAESVTKLATLAKKQIELAPKLEVKK